jgi:hypothetical protein
MYLSPEKVGQFPIQIAFDCKDHAVPIDVKGVEEFGGLVADVGVHKGVIVAAKGFSSAAKARAEVLQIQLYSVVDTREHPWQAKDVALPMLCDFRGVSMQLRVTTSAPTRIRPFG